MIFTRYLYLQDEVKIALMASLLNKSNASIFWAYELYYSGFEKELFGLLWKIYYAFYYTLNPAFQQYFIKKHKHWLKMDASIERDKIICIIVNNLLIRPFNSFLSASTRPSNSFFRSTQCFDREKLFDLLGASSKTANWDAPISYLFPDGEILLVASTNRGRFPSKPID